MFVRGQVKSRMHRLNSINRKVNRCKLREISSIGFKLLKREFKI